MILTQALSHANLLSVLATSPVVEHEIRFGFRDALTMIFLTLGLFFGFTASVGLLRMPDLYCRMQAATKAGTLGVTLMIAAVAIYFADSGVAALAAVTILFLLLTAPIASHLIARAAYFVDVERWENTTCDDLAGCYDWDTHTLYQTPELNTGRSDRTKFDADPAD